MIKAVIFDMDGLLIDSEPLWRKAEMKVFNSINISLSEDDCRSTIGMRIDEVVKHWAGVYKEKNINIPFIIDEINNSMVQQIATEGKAMPGVYDVINLCRRKKIPMAIASSSSLQLIKQVAAQLNILNDMEFIHSAYEMDFGKPHPQVFIETGQRLNVDPQNCLVFEDSKFGVIAARAAMMKVIAVPDAIELGNKEFGIAHKVLSSLMEFTEEMLDKL